VRLLGISNSYPPTAGGGYGEICADVMSGLAGRGHAVTMLTVREQGADADAARDGVRVRRELLPALAAWRRPAPGVRALRNDTEVVSSALREGVDAALVWHMRGLVKPPLRLLHDACVPVLYQLHDRWVLYERAGALYMPWARLDRAGARAAREALGRLAAPGGEWRAPPIREEGVVCFVSRWLEEEYRRRGWEPRRRELVPCGVDLARFAAVAERPAAIPPSRLLFAGRVHRDKGLDVAVRALAAGPEQVTMTAVGPVDDERHAAEVRRLAESLGVSDRIAWHGEVARDGVLELMREHDVVVYPSRNTEAYSLGLLEALAAERLIVTSAVGGPREYLRDRGNALLFEPEDHSAMAGLLIELTTGPSLPAQLVAGARETARGLSLEVILDRIEKLLEVSGR
jgi:glycosyltransferase involved in cell wall biosynthesis